MPHARNCFIIFALTLLGFGVLMVHSASLTARPSDAEQIYLSRHLTFVCVGIVAAALSVIFPIRDWKYCTPWLLLAALLLLIGIFLPGVGKQVNGARRWLSLGPVTLQPSELAKIVIPLYLASCLVSLRDRAGRWFDSLKLLVPVGVVVGLVLIQPDLGTALFLLAGAALTLFVGGWPLRNFLVCGLLLVPLAGSVLFLKPYQLKRITGFVDTWRNVDEAPYQIQQAFVSIADGGLWGVGLGKGWQKLSYLPEANTDFVFAVVAEELGLVGAGGVIALWIALFAAGWKLLAPLPRDSFEFIAGFVLLMQIVLQAALNVAVVTALVPPKGIPHPLLSYGGSNLVVSLISLGLVLKLTSSRRIASLNQHEIESSDILSSPSPSDGGEFDRQEKVA